MRSLSGRWRGRIEGITEIDKIDNKKRGLKTSFFISYLKKIRYICLDTNVSKKSSLPAIVFVGISGFSLLS